jgi:GNAT superfamily N-acetyltransferase
VTAPFARGRGIARKMLKTLEGQARECGLKTLRLDTNRTLKDYRAEGYCEISPLVSKALVVSRRDAAAGSLVQLEAPSGDR